MNIIDYLDTAVLAALVPAVTYQIASAWRERRRRNKRTANTQAALLVHICDEAFTRGHRTDEASRAVTKLYADIEAAKENGWLKDIMERFKNLTVKSR